MSATKEIICGVSCDCAMQKPTVCSASTSCKDKASGKCSCAEGVCEASKCADGVKLNSLDRTPPWGSSKQSYATIICNIKPYLL
ncbi:hypothetical protein RQP46_004331 [Phenoliferia psychrophenolica]